jgi:DNA-binding NtrC family response regulator
VSVPPLRQRKEDVPLLIEHFLHQFRLPGRPVKMVSKEASAFLVDYPWPGNVRELANTIERLVILSPGPVIGPVDLPPDVREPQQALAEVDAPDLPLIEMERRHIVKVLERTQGKKAEAARLLGIHLKTLNRKLKQYRISR